MDIYLVNETTTLTDLEAAKIAWACDYQARFHLGRTGWRSDIRCVFAAGGAEAHIPAGVSVLHLLDTSDQPSALGYHDEDGNEIPYCRAFVQTALQDGQEISEIASHELLELAVDPHLNLTALTGDNRRLYAVEVGDPVQGTGYDVGAPEGRPVGVRVANFVLPAYFDPRTTTERVDFRGALSAPFTLAPQGYVSWIDTTRFSAGWQQQLGAARTAPPATVGDRLDRR